MSDDDTPMSGADDDATSDAPMASDASTTADGEPTVPETAAAASDEPDAPVAAGDAAAPGSGARSGVFVPRWVAVLVGGLVALLVVGGVGFAIGRATDDDHDGPRVEAGPGSGMPGMPGGPQGGPGGGPEGGPRGGGPNGGDELPFPTPDGGDRGGDGEGEGEGEGFPGRGVLLGVAVQDAGGDTEGAEVARVVAGSPADDAGLEAGDVITEVDGTSVTDAQSLVDAIGEHDTGDEVSITYERDGESSTVDVTLVGSSAGDSTATD